MTGKFVYFIRPVGLRGPVKIGCSKNPPGCLNAMLPWSPIELEIVATFPGEHADEVALHRHFAEQAMQGEWFGISDELDAMIEAVRRGEKPTPSRDAGPCLTRRIASLKSVITRQISTAEARVYSHRLNHGTGRPAHIRAIIEGWNGNQFGPPSVEDQRALAAYLTELKAMPAFRGDWRARREAWEAYRDGPQGIAA